MPAPKEARIGKLGIIAGGGALPGRLLEACDQQNIDVFVVALAGQADPAIYAGRQSLVIRPGAAGKIINTLREEGVKDLVLIGSLRRPSLRELKPDLRTAKFFANIGFKALGDDGLLKALRHELEGEGFTIHGIQEFVHDLLAPEGAFGACKPGKAHQSDIKRGVEVLRGIGQYDVGQALVIQEGIILGIEAAEGTDELINRCAAYKRSGRPPILVKMAKPGQDRGLDLPTIGPETVRNCIAKGIGGIVIHSGSTLIAEPEKVASLADDANLFILGIEPKQPDNERS